MEDANWLSYKRNELARRWTKQTGHCLRATSQTWACEIAHHCGIKDSRLSVPCSLMHEGNEISLFLCANAFDRDALAFGRLYLMILNEFLSQLEHFSGSLRLNIGKPPGLVKVWANRWAKHRLHILVQHHPEYVFYDEDPAAWTSIQNDPKVATWKDKCGSDLPIFVVNTDWLQREAARTTPNLVLANGQSRPVVLFPPFLSFSMRQPVITANLLMPLLQHLTPLEGISRRFIQHFAMKLDLR